MILVLLTGLFLVGVTVMLHAATMFWWTVHVRRTFPGPLGPPGSWATIRLLARTATALTLLLFSEAVLWALLFVALSDDTGIRTFQDALYFSLATFSTVGYGDVTIAGPWRLLAGIEAMNGVLLLGWSTATFYSIVNFIWNREAGPKNRPAEPAAPTSPGPPPGGEH